MFRFCLAVALAASVIIQGAEPGHAQVAAGAAQAEAEARARVACGAATLVSAQYLPGGLLRVTCSQQSQSSNASQAAVAGTGLATVPLLGAVLGVTLIGIVGGGGNPAQTTSSVPATSTTATTTTTGQR